MSYTPPAGNAATLVFESGYSPPSGTSATLSFVPPNPIGTAAVGLSVQVCPTGSAVLPIDVITGETGVSVLPVDVLIVPGGYAVAPISVDVCPTGHASLPLSVASAEPGAAEIPIAVLVAAGGAAQINIEVIVSQVGKAMATLGVWVGETGQSAMACVVSVVDAATGSGTSTVADKGGAAGVWGAIVAIDGIDVSADVIGEIVIEAEEGAARVADLALSRTGAITIQEWTGKPVMISIADLSSGTPTDVMLLFSGVVDLPRLDMNSSRIVLSCTDNRQGIVSGLSWEQIEALVGGYWSPAVFNKSASSWVYANDRLSTVAAALDLSPAGELRMTPWAAKAVADLSFDDDSVLDGSVVPDIAERSSLTNRIDINFGFRFPRIKSEGHVLNYDYLAVNETAFVFWVRDGNQFLSRQAVLSAISSAGGTVVSIDWTALPTTDQIIPGTAGAPAGVWVPNPYVDPNLCLGFEAVVSFDFTQQAEEQHKIAVVNQKSVDAIGLMRAEMSGALEGIYTDPVAVEQNIFLYKTGTTSIPPLDLAIPVPGTTVAATPTLTSDSDRAAADAAMETLIAVAMAKIFQSHRNSTLPFSVPLNPVLDTDKTAAISAQGVEAQGKVRKLKHRLNADTGEAISEVQLAICSAAGVGIVHDEDAITAPDGIADGTSGTLADPIVVWNGLAGQDGELTITFPGVQENQRATDVQVISSTFAAPLAEDLLTITL